MIQYLTSVRAWENCLLTSPLCEEVMRVTRTIQRIRPRWHSQIQNKTIWIPDTRLTSEQLTLILTTTKVLCLLDTTRLRRCDPPVWDSHDQRSSRSRKRIAPPKIWSNLPQFLRPYQSRKTRFQLTLRTSHRRTSRKSKISAVAPMARSH